MKINYLKQAGGVLIPASDLDSEKTLKLKTGGLYEVEIKQTRNPKFHAKVFAFFNFCFEHWRGDLEFISEQKQFDVFRANLTVLAGYYDSFYKIDGSVRIEAKSIAYSAMSQQEFEQFYIALTNAAMKHIFKDSSEQTYQQLIGFF